LTRTAKERYDASVSAKGVRGTTDADERRRAPRVLVDLEVDYGLEENYLFAYITDLSATGIFIRTIAPEPAGTHLNLRFTPDLDADPDDLTFELEGEVIWVNPHRPGAPDSLHPGMGVRFLGLSDDDRRRLIELVRRIAYLT
jgi:type IV pilus assembly protein PilZ